MRVRRSNHTIYTINYHFVWCPKYRNAVLNRVESSLKEGVRTVADEYGYDILSWSERRVFRH